MPVAVMLALLLALWVATNLRALLTNRPVGFFEHAIVPRVMRYLGSNHDTQCQFFTNVVPGEWLLLMDSVRQYDPSVTNDNLGRLCIHLEKPERMYVFCPIAPDGTVIAVSQTEPYTGYAGTGLRFWMFSRDELLHEKRSFMFNDGATEMLGDQDVSWYYQSKLKGLDRKQLEAEIHYRASNGLPRLNMQ